MNYYKNFNLKFTSESSYLNWHTIEKGIITGYTISAILFNHTMKLIIKSAEKKNAEAQYLQLAPDSPQ